jgi:uncharacterized RDD family membrane protein YckC
VTTPTFAATPDPTAVVGRRILAYGIDLLVVGAIGVALMLPLFNGVAERAPSDQVTCAATRIEDPSTFETRRVEGSDLCLEIGDEVLYVPDADANRLTSQVYGIGFGLQILNLVVLQGLTGASLGKLLVGLRVVREDGSTAGIGWAALRWILLLVDSACCFLPGAVLVFSTKGHRRIGDMAASTFVVRRHDVGTPPSVPGVTASFVTAPGAGQGYPAPGAQGWGAPPAAPGWGGAPTGWAPPPTAPAPATPPSADPDGPTWDEARNTYIQYDRPREQWVQWDDATSTWKPIDS